MRGAEFDTTGFMPEGQNTTIPRADDTSAPLLEPIQAPALPFSPTDKRRGDIHSILEHTPRIEHMKDNTPGIAVLVPIHHDSRLETITHTFESLAQQRDTSGKDMTVVIGDNGLTPSGGRDLQALADKYALDMTIVDAHPQNNAEKNAAHGRNVALKEMWARAEQDDRFRKGGILLLDSDTALLPGAIDSMTQTFSDYQGTVAVSAKNISVPDIDARAREHHIRLLQGQGLETGKVRLLPRLYSDGKIKADAIIALGSDVALKTCGVMVSADALRSVGQRPFVRMPNGSAEDMLFSAAISAYGDLRHDPNAIVLDMARESAAETRKQRGNWGRDHAILYSDLSHIGQVAPELRVLEPLGGKWIEWKVPGVETSGLIINPAQLKSVGADLREALASDGGESFGKDFDTQEIQDGLTLLSGVTRYLDQVRPQAHIQVRHDLPKPGIPDPSETRFSKDSLTGLLAGNIMGMQDLQKAGSPLIFFGVRQAASW